MGVNQLDILKGRVTQLKEYFDKTTLIFETRVEEMEKAQQIEPEGAGDEEE